jgi:hypothetical protein
LHLLGQSGQSRPAAKQDEWPVGMAIKQYRHEFRRPRGVYLSINQVNDIEEAFSNFGAGADDIDLILIGTSGAAGSFTE